MEDKKKDITSKIIRVTCPETNCGKDIIIYIDELKGKSFIKCPDGHEFLFHANYKDNSLFLKLDKY